MHSLRETPKLGAAAGAGTRMRIFGSLSPRGSASPQPTDYYVGIPGLSGKMDEAATDEFFYYLSILMRMTKNSDFGAIPAGFTYLAQFCAHDLTINSILSLELGDIRKPDNMRSRALMLDTLYGLGPAIDKSAYDRPEAGKEFCPFFRLSSIAHLKGHCADPHSGPRRDIGRVRFDNACDAKATPTGAALVADARNDDNAVLSQLTAAFAMAHNKAFEAFPEKDAAGGELSLSDRFSLARIAVTHAYHGIIRHEFLRLFLSDDVYRYYNSLTDTAGLLWTPETANPVSREFADAVYRVGHAMVRDEYTFGACQKGGHTVDSVLGHSSSRDPATTPLDKRWIAEWSRFFKVCGQVGPVGKPQYSKKIRPSIAMGLDSTVAAEGGDGLAWRDLVRSAISGVVKTRTLADWFAKAIAQELPPGTMPDIISALGKIDTHPMPELGLWAATEFFDDGYKKMPSNLVDKLLEDPPLGLYVLIEASVFENGDRLGPLGSLIVAETFFRSLLDAEKTLAEQAAGLDNPTDPKTLADAIFTCAPKSMSAFLTWIDGRLPPSEKTAPHGEGTSVGLPFI